MIDKWDVYNVLSTVEWKSSMQIRDELAVSQGIRPSSMQYFNLLSPVHVGLYSLVRDGFATLREREITGEKRTVEGHDTIFEYRQSGKGRPSFELDPLPEPLPV